MSASIQPYIADPQRFPNTFMSQQKTSIILDLEAVDDDVYQSVQRKTSMTKRKHSMHKGFVLGHGIQSVQMDLQEDNFKVNSIHGVFVGPVDHKTPIVYYLERLQNANGSVARTVEGRQNGRIVFSGIASLTKLNASTTVDPSSRRKMSSIPAPESLPILEASCAQNETHMPKEFEKGMERLMKLWQDNNIEFRAIDQKCWLSPCDQNKEVASFWIKCNGKFNSDSKQAALGFFSGLCSEAMPGQQRAISSQQTLWFNQVDFNPNDWIYCELSALQQLRQCGNFLVCKFWDKSGEILASAVQEIDLAPRAKF